MKNPLIVLAAATLLTGCATVEKVAIAPDVTTALKGKTLAVTTRAAKPDFSALTPAKGAFGMIGALTAISAGNEIVKTNNVAVPADAIGQALGAQLQGMRGMQLVAAPLSVTSNELDQIVAASNGTANYILDVQTTNWMFSYFPTVWNRYRVIHAAQARLIDAGSKKIVAQGSCFYAPDHSDSAPTYDQLVDNQAAGLKKALATAGDDCAATLKRDILAL